MLKNSQTSYGIIAKSFHWIIFVLVLGMIFAGYFMGDIADKPTRAMVVNAHKLTGLCILSLMILRMLWAFMNPKPELPAGTPSWQRVLERMVHVLLYVLLIAMPLSGWVGAVAAGHAPHLFALQFSLPIAQSHALDDFSFSIHDVLAVVIITLVSLHILAALYHHVIKKDGILRRML